jgi:hypothetical protein
MTPAVLANWWPIFAGFIVDFPILCLPERTREGSSLGSTTNLPKIRMPAAGFNSFQLQRVIVTYEEPALSYQQAIDPLTAENYTG